MHENLTLEGRKAQTTGLALDARWLVMRRYSGRSHLIKHADLNLITGALKQP